MAVPTPFSECAAPSHGHLVRMLTFACGLLVDRRGVPGSGTSEGKGAQRLPTEGQVPVPVQGTWLHGQALLQCGDGQRGPAGSLGEDGATGHRPQPRPRTKAWKKHGAWWGGPSRAALSLALSLRSCGQPCPLLQGVSPRPGGLPPLLPFRACHSHPRKSAKPMTAD